jgi:DNA-directed RNA polymerase subunit beta
MNLKNLIFRQGTFVINGVARVIINQNLQSPSIYYNSGSDHNGIPIYRNVGYLLVEMEVNWKDLNDIANLGNWK